MRGRECPAPRAQASLAYPDQLRLHAKFRQHRLTCDRSLAEKRIYPSLNVNRSGTRREELLIAPDILPKVWILRKLLFGMDELEATEFLLDKLRATKNNDEFFGSMKKGS